MSSIYRVGFGSAEDGTWKKGGRNVSEFGHIVIQRLIIDGVVLTKEDVPEPEKGEMGFNRDTFLYIPEEVSGTASSVGRVSGERGHGHSHNAGHGGIPDDPGQDDTEDTGQTSTPDDTEEGGS